MKKNSIKKYKLGFTLVELLVTIVLFSLLLGTALYSFRFVSINMRNVNNTNPQQAMNFNLLKDAFSSTYYYIDTDEKKLNGKGRYFHYFNGEKLVCRFVSSASLFYDELVLVQLSFVDSQLIYEEGKIFDKNIDYKKLNNIRLTQKVTILKNLQSFEFKYESGSGVAPTLKKEIPRSVSVEFEKNKKKYSYFFSIQSKNLMELEVLIRDYDLSRSTVVGQL